LVGGHGRQSGGYFIHWVLVSGHGVRHPVDQLCRGYMQFLLSVGAVAREVSNLVAFVAGAAGGSVSAAGVSVGRLGLGDVHLVDVPLFILHLDRPPLGVSVPPVVVPVSACSVCIDVHRDGGVVQVAGGVSGIVSSDVGAARLLVGGVGLCEPVPVGRWWSARGVLVLFEHLVDEEL
jgi:hypothetical protein